MISEREDLEGLLLHPGYLRFAAYARKHWGDEITALLRTAVNDTNDANALQKMRQIIVAKDAIDRLLAWPEERIAALIAQKQTAATSTTMSRGGV